MTTKLAQEDRYNSLSIRPEQITESMIWAVTMLSCRVYDDDCSAASGKASMLMTLALDEWETSGLARRVIFTVSRFMLKAVQPDALVPERRVCEQEMLDALQDYGDDQK